MFEDKQEQNTPPNKDNLPVKLLSELIPNIKIIEHSKLPAVPAIYLVFTPDKRLLDIGKTDNLKEYWNKHNKYEYFVKASPDCKIGYFTYDLVDNFKNVVEEFYKNNPGKSDSDSSGSPKLALTPTFAPQEPDTENQEENKSDKEDSSLIQQRCQNVISLIIRLMQVLDEDKEKERRFFKWQQYIIKASANYRIVEMYANEGRDLILQLHDSIISSTLSIKDLEYMEQQFSQEIEQAKAKRQVERCMPILVEYLRIYKQSDVETPNSHVKYDPQTAILTYHNKEDPTQFLAAQWTGKSWKYLKGKLTSEIEKAILEQKEVIYKASANLQKPKRGLSR